MTKTIKTKRPEVGDIFFGEDAFIIGKRRKKDSVIEVCVTKEQCIEKVNKVEKIMSKGKLFSFNKTVDEDISSIDETRKNASFVVEFIEQKDELKLLHSKLPESFLVRARRLKDSKFDPNGEVIEFYTSGRFENTFNGNLEIIGKLKNIK